MTALRLAILRTVRKIGDPLLGHILDEVRQVDPAAADAARGEVRQMVIDGLLRMKEDSVDHDWSYRLTDAGRAALDAAEAVS